MPENGPKAKASDYAKAKYPQVRTALLSEWISTEEEVEWLVEAGAYLRACWLKEVEYLGAAPLDEEKTHYLWDDFHQSEITNLRSEARISLKKYAKAHRFDGIVDDFQKAFKQRTWRASVDALSGVLTVIAALLKALLHILKTMADGFLHIAGIIMIGLIIRAMFPSLWHEAQNALKLAFGLN